MKYSFTTAGLMALVYSSAVTVTAALPTERTATKTAHVIDVHRDWDGMRANIARKSQKQKRQSDGPDYLDYAGYWFANITAGGQPASVLFDTGSADLWLVDPSAGSDATNGVQTWDPTTADNTSQMGGETFNIGYGQGGNGVSGNVYQTDVCIGEACTTMAVGSATTDQGLGTFPRSGILGMAFKGGNSVSPDQQNTFMESLQGSLSEPIFVTKFTPEGSTSQIAFGSNPFDFVAPMQEIQVDSSSSSAYPYSWSYTGVDYSKNGQSLGTFDVVFDSGGPMTSAAEDIVRGYYDGVNGASDVNGDASSWTVPCGTELPDLTLTLGSATLTIPGEKFYNGNTNTSGDCTVWFVKENSATRGVIGDPFFCEHVVIFNQQNSTISWGNQS
ncbi:hypothetical protein PISL3812_00018 [Talaromyces islandicus]|uniref:Peptidase A1 domain-containing protein n=1 Tax=Talaromyces islandicus TaxID=28573 RepID=A0A0U1LI35_TALIS|nr:hypothetical protein PISL3812_00018 [Talaromyces islandicus]